MIARKPALLVALGLLLMAAAFGIITMRYIVRLEPLASMPKELLIRELGAILQIRIDRAFARLERSQER